MPETSNTVASTADTAARLYPDGNASQNQQTNAGNNKSFKPGPAYVVTNMTEGKTTFIDPNTGKSSAMETRNDVTHDSKQA